VLCQLSYGHRDIGNKTAVPIRRILSGERRFASGRAAREEPSDLGGSNNDSVGHVSQPSLAGMNALFYIRRKSVRWLLALHGLAGWQWTVPTIFAASLTAAGKPYSVS